jgi:hypothetical protein
MRKLPLLILVVVAAGVLSPSLAHAFGTERQGFGLGIGSGTGATGVSGKLMVGSAGAFQGVVGFWGHSGDSSGPGPGQYRSIDGVALSLDYLFEMPSLATTQYFNLDWNFGFGGGIGVATSGGTPGVAVAGVAGLEFNFTKVPIDLTVEYRPGVGLLPDVGIGLIGFTAHLRVWF